MAAGEEADLLAGFPGGIAGGAQWMTTALPNRATQEHLQPLAPPQVHHCFFSLIPASLYPTPLIRKEGKEEEGEESGRLRCWRFTKKDHGIGGVSHGTPHITSHLTFSLGLVFFFGPCSECDWPASIVVVSMQLLDGGKTMQISLSFVTMILAQV